MKVNECMCSNVVCAKPEDTICNVAKLMGDNHIGCIPVCDNSNKVLGLVTDRDLILRSIACDKDAKNTPVSDIMSTNVCCCNSDCDISYATDIMSKYQIRRVPVVDDNKLVGIITFGDIVRYPEITEKQVCATAECICKKGTDTKNAE